MASVTGIFFDFLPASKLLFKIAVMEWYQIKFSHFDLQIKKDQEFITSFVRLYHKTKQPKNLALFSLKISQCEALCYFISAPKEHKPELTKILSHYDSTSVSQPVIRDLKLEIGNTQFVLQ